MSRNGSGTYNLPAGNPVVTGTTITSSWANTTLSDIATALTGSIAADGQTPVTGNLNMGTNKISNMADPTLSTDAATKNYVDTIFPSGGIVMWSGAIASIPSGWHICDGTSGTPDLRDRFVIGAGNSYAVSATGGSKDAIVVSHTHTATSTVTDSGHTHTASVPYSTSNARWSGGGADAFGQGPSTLTTNSSTTGVSVATSVASTGSSGTNANLPPYYALAYIMKL